MVLAVSGKVHTIVCRESPPISVRSRNMEQLSNLQAAKSSREIQWALEKKVTKLANPLKLFLPSPQTVFSEYFFAQPIFLVAV